ncbi:hypothetical protein [Spiroplasma floricola]|uniref:Uncharacterized protein n=1 Tax=Spiroplasma floricola 23-6 TaxID=1336749 RepID=A0A2K8SF27_9MOLU|nr:hypothetical protein [Spiroplasma floricola]AUB32044.1 hypothetical protein SFLOR_v1c09960 [Spiroplasma floricola 23-6]
MKKKKNYKLFFVSILLLFTISILSFLIYSYTKSNNVEIKGENDTQEKEKPSVIKKTDFAKKNLSINFSLEQKIYIINFSKEKLFKMNEFKYYFILEFNKLGPKNNSINLSYLINNPKKPTEISVKYDGTNKRAREKVRG